MYNLSKATRADDNTIEYLRTIASFQFSFDVGFCLFPENKVFFIQRSLSTNRIRNVLTEDGKLYLVLRAQDNLFSLTELSGETIRRCTTPPSFRFVIQSDVSKFIRDGKNVFCKFVIDADRNIRSGDEVLVVDEDDNLLAVGRARVSGEEVKHYKRGLAVIVKRGIKNGDQDTSERN